MNKASRFLVAKALARLGESPILPLLQFAAGCLHQNSLALLICDHGKRRAAFSRYFSGLIGGCDAYFCTAPAPD
ncbi:MAG: hypothetical protein COA52_19695 [Hyphomicrobiales bacterium]|nr:MAG: hypothetical protein COA52_19695 [Hyphomicrobiales bacterium]